ncbi:MAG: cell envelope integrity EipB family protein [Hyphomicrobiales bacterium]|nr:cell envelope integrity EipB family protein [Hyphomicrobiales bacterium]MBV9975965.1 cell envelope integrity EipB family protein [Hyphomicrobiales bacterium]
MPRKNRILRQIAFASLIGIGLCGEAFATPKIVLVPHRAVYELSLLSSKGVNSVDEARGRLVFEITGTACDGYATNFRQVTQLSGSESSQDRSFDVRSTSFEAGDGSLLRFTNDAVRGDRTDHTEGKAQARPDGVEITVQKPEPSSLTAPSETLFPNAHIKRLVEEALNGSKLFSAKIFDGSDTGNKVYDTLAVIGAPVSADAAQHAETAANAEQLKGHASWPVTLSYFEPGAGEREPAYVMSFVLYDNGVSRALTLNYGDFSLKGELKSIEFLNSPSCDK